MSDLPIELWRLGAISGAVRDEAGEPVVGIPVRVLVRVPIAGHRYWAGGVVTLTDDRGMYRIGGVGRGSYVVCVPSAQTSIPDGLPASANARPANPIDAFGPPPVSRADPAIRLPGAKLVQSGYAVAGSLDGTQAYPTYFYPNARSLTDASMIELAGGEERRNVDITIQPARAWTISGRLIGPAVPLDRFLIRLVPDMEAAAADLHQAISVSKPDGSFVLPSVPQGSYTLEVSRTLETLQSNGWAPCCGQLPATPLVSPTFFVTPFLWTSALGDVNYFVRSFGSGDEYSASVHIDVQNDLSNLPVQLQPSATLSGRIVGEDGRPVSGRPVNAHPADGSVNRGLWHTTKTDADGRFLIDGLKAGDYFLGAVGSIKTVVGQDGDHTGRPVAVGPGTSATDLLVTITTPTATLSGEVRDRNERLLAVGVVVLFPADPSLWPDFGSDPSRIRSVTFLGRAGYQFTRVQSGEYCLVALDSSMEYAWQEPGFLAKLAGIADRVTVRAAENKVLSLHQRQVTR